MTDKLVKHGWHWSFGWLRRPEMDQNNMYCYEEPDGDLVFVRKREHRVQLYLDCRHDEEVSENYTCIAPVPRRTAYKRRTVT
jgi:hypothetical protein